MKNDLLITIFTFNRPDYLAINLLGLHLQTYKAFDVMIVDDSSSEPVQENALIKNIVSRLESDGHHVHFYIMKVNGGIGKARREATKSIHRNWDYCFDLNDDHFMEVDCIEKMMRTIKSDDKIGLVVSCTPMIFWEESEFKRDFETFKNKLNKITFVNGAPQFNRCVDYVYDIKEPVLIDHGSQFIYRTGVVNPDDLPEGYSKVGFTEETDFSLRFRKAGYKLMFQPDAINWHMLSPKGGIRSVNNLDRVEACKADWGIFINNWKEWLSDESNNS